MRICSGPGCDLDLDNPSDGTAPRRKGAETCSGACRAARSRAKKDPDSAANRSDRFWKGLAEIWGNPTFAAMSTHPRRKRDRRGLGVTFAER